MGTLIGARICYRYRVCRGGTTETLSGAINRTVIDRQGDDIRPINISGETEQLRSVIKLRGAAPGLVCIAH